MNRRHFLATTASAACASSVRSAPVDKVLSTQVIDRVELRTLQVKWPRHVGKNALLDHHGFGPQARVAILHTKEGASGWGHLLGGNKDLPQLIENLKGKPVSSLIDPKKGITRPQLKPFDIALHDLAGTIRQEPVWKMLGAETPTLTKCYSGMIYFDDLDPADKPKGIDQVLENCRADIEMGYHQLKVKIGRGHKWMEPKKGLQRDIEVVNAIRQSFPDTEILVDGNNGFTVESFIKFLKGIGDTPLFWIEEPFHETRDNWPKLRDWLLANGRSEFFRADGEQRPDHPVLEELEKNKSLNMRLQDICGHGFSNWRKLMPRLESKGVAASPHNWGSPLKMVYTAHLAAALGNTPTVEGVSGGVEGADFGENHLRDGQYHPSTQPGFGLKLEA